MAADRSLNPHIHEVKKVYQPVKFTHVSKKTVLTKIEIKNRYDFIDLSHLDFSWFIEEDGKEIQNGNLGNMKLGPGETDLFNFNRQTLLHKQGSEYLLKIRAHSKIGSATISKGHLVAWDQFKLPIENPAQPTQSTDLPGLEMTEAGHLIEVVGEDFKITFDRNKGNLSQYHSIKNFLFL